MANRILSIWFPYLKTDWITLRKPLLQGCPLVLAAPDHGRMVITEANHFAGAQGIEAGMVVADARVIVPSVEVIEDKPDFSKKLLQRIAEWFIRYSPHVGIDPPDGIILDASGCSHLWGGEKLYQQNIVTRLKNFGYEVKVAMAGTIGAAWAMSHFLSSASFDETGKQITSLFSLPAEALRLEAETAERLHKLGLHQVSDFIALPRRVLRRRFGQHILQRINQALGHAEEIIDPVQPPEPYHERLTSLDPITTSTGIEIAIEQLLNSLCDRLRQEQKGLRLAVLKCYRVDGKIEKIQVGTNRPSCNSHHLFKLFQLKIETIEPSLGIELFTLDAPKIEDVLPQQEKIWQETGGLDDINLSELLDRLNGRFEGNYTHRYVPDEHHWPERSFKPVSSLEEITTAAWKVEKSRPIQLLSAPESIQVTAPIPDYPPMLFRYKGKLHTIKKADGPERIEREWWLDQGQHRDYYAVEDEEGRRYWLFRSGHYTDSSYQWFIHGFFA
jgi:protein ImuB